MSQQPYRQLQTPMPIELTTHQHAVVYANAKRLLIIAGAGSGKTMTIVHRVARLVIEGCDPVNICIVTFTNQAGQEIARRLTDFLPDAKLGYVGTIHGLCLRLLTKYGALIGYQPNIAVLDEDHADALLFDMADLIGYSKLSKTKIRDARDTYGSESLHRHRELETHLSGELTVAAAYYKRLKQGNAIDYRGLLSEAARLLSIVPDDSAVGRALFDHLLVDEFQDVCDHDVNVFDLLRAENHCYVGDPDQAIYGFRGGKVNHILELAESEEWTVVRLEDNFRCDEAICNAAQTLIARNVGRVPKVTRSATGIKGAVIVMPQAGNDVQEAAQICASVQESFKEGGIQPTEIAILARTNVAVNDIRAIAMGYDFPIEKVPTDDEQTPGWKFCRACVEMLACPSNDMAMEYWLGLRYADKGEKARQLRAAAITAQKSIAEIFFIGGAPKVTLETIQTELIHNGVHHEAVLRTSAILATLTQDATVADLSLAMRHQVGIEQKRNGVTITTMHAAKGREWKIVYLAGMEQQVIPGTSKNTDTEEERRVCYVAATRAKHVLLISVAANRRQGFGLRKPVPHTPTQFIVEMGCTDIGAYIGNREQPAHIEQ